MPVTPPNLCRLPDIAPMPTPLARYLPQPDAQPWFAALPQPLRAHLLSHAALRRLPAGYALFRRGDPPCGLYAVPSGSLTIGAVDEHGKEALLTAAGPATWFGEIALFDGLPRTHDAIALEDTLLLHVPQAALLALLDAAPHYWRDVALLMAQKLRLSFLTVEAISVMPAAQRLAARLLMIADEQPGRDGDWPGARRLSGHAGRVARLHAAVRAGDDPVRARHPGIGHAARRPVPAGLDRHDPVAARLRRGARRIRRADLLARAAMDRRHRRERRRGLARGDLSGARTGKSTSPGPFPEPGLAGCAAARAAASVRVFRDNKVWNIPQ